MAVMSSMLFAFVNVATMAHAHEVLPAIADMRLEGDRMTFDMRMNAEGFIAGIDQSSVTDTNSAPQAEDYDAIRALDPAELEAAFVQFWPTFAELTDIQFDGVTAELEFVAFEAGALGNVEDPRTSTLRFNAIAPQGAQAIDVGWAPEFGTLVIRQMGVDAPYDGYLEAGARSGPVAIGGGDQAGGIATFFNYIPVGFDHIIPKGLDHILFVLGLFFLSTRMKPLVWQISAFTLAHTITLALAALGYVTIPGSIVEPLIALSIVYVAVENIFTTGLSPWRPAIVFGFGLLHGLGFASVLAEFGLPDGSFIPALIGFNIGVEVGQLAVIGVAYVCVMKAIDFERTGEASKGWAAAYLIAMCAVIALLIPLAGLDAIADLIPLIAAVALLLGFSAASVSVGRYDSYREIVAMPGSVIIAVIAAYWCVERVFL